MAQADYVISPNPTGLAMREEINQIFQAALTSNSGSTAPTTTAPYSMWVDTSNGTTHYLKMRNHTNDAWVSIASYDVATKTIKPTSLINVSTDNAIVRFDGTTGAAQNSGVIIDDNNNVGIGTSSPSSKLTVLNDSINIESSNTSPERSYIWLGKYSGSAAYQYGTHIGCYHNYGVTSGASLIISPSNIDVLSIDSGGNTLHLSPLGGLGYGTGAGGTVTQLTSKSTAVTLNKPTGQITMNNAALAAGTEVGFVVNNTLVGGNDTIIVAQSGFAINTNNYQIRCVATATNSFVIYVKNISAESLSDALVINFAIIKGVNS